MAGGCKNTKAANFNGSASFDDFSCTFLLKNQNNCHWFEDVEPDPDNDKSFTLSYSVKGQGWVFFHDYAPDMYINTRENLFNAKDSILYHNNKGPYGQFHNPDDIKPFFIDVIFSAGQDILLESINWITEFLQQNGDDFDDKDQKLDQPFNTLSHISIWNSTQHSGRLPVSRIFRLSNLDESRRLKGMWSLNDFRDVVVNKGEQFIMSIFKDYAVDDANTDYDKAWYNKELLIDSWFCVRFEFDNMTANKVILHDTNIVASKSMR